MRTLLCHYAQYMVQAGSLNLTDDARVSASVDDSCLSRTRLRSRRLRYLDYCFGSLHPALIWMDIVTVVMLSPAIVALVLATFSTISFIPPMSLHTGTECPSTTSHYRHRLTSHTDLLYVPPRTTCCANIKTNPHRSRSQ